MTAGADETTPTPGGALPWGTQWDLARAADPGVDWDAVHVTLGFQDGRAGGRAPVNRYFGLCQELPGGGLRLGPFGMTMMAGPPRAMVAEAAYTALLERVAGFRVDGGLLVLLDASGHEVLAFVPSMPPETPAEETPETPTEETAETPTEETPLAETPAQEGPG